MFKYFQCPNGEKTEIDACLKQCTQCERCLSLPTLRMISTQRTWTGKPSTTQLLKGTREAYLEIIHNDLVMAPQERAFMLLGSKVHGNLEQYTPSELSEERLEDENTTGAFDLYDAENQTLYDYKTWGSYKVMKALGIEMVDVPTGEYYKTGDKKGQEKTRKEPRQCKPDMEETELQMNDYRIKLESAGFQVKRMFVEAIVRDGGTFSATSRGIDKNIYLIPITRMDDEFVKLYFTNKSKDLLTALDTKTMPPPCTDKECWEGRKCKDYCSASQYCDKGQKIRGEL
jgi:hypothetical protein